MTLTFPKRVLFYGLLTLLTLLSIEGMARIAYYAAYSQGYGSGPPDTGVNWSSLNDRVVEPEQLRHPFYGFTRQRPMAALWAGGLHCSGHRTPVLSTFDAAGFGRPAAIPPRTRF